MKYTIFAAIIGLASATSSAAPDAKTCDCYFKYRECQGGPDANQSFCASQFTGCANYNPFTGEEQAPYFANLQANCKAATTSAPGGYPTAPPTYGASSSAPAPTYPAGKPDAKTCECYAKLGQCQTGPNANQATCASEFASCSGNNPYTGDSAATAYFDNLKKNCPTSSAPAPSSTPTAPGKPDAKTCECYAKLGQCQTGPNANQATCASEFASCSGNNPYTGDSAATAYFDNLKKNCPTSSAPAPSSTPTAPGKPDAKTCECYAKLGQCQTAPSANQASCASEFASCSGNNPYTGDDRATAYFDNLKKNCPAGGPPTPSSAPQPSGTPTGPTGKPDANVCACYAKLGQCQTAPSANQASCASEFASCSGNNPYTGDDRATAYFDNLKKNCPAGGPTSPSSAPQPSGTPTGPTGKPDANVCACYDQANKCRVGPGANQSFCSSQFASCAGYNPYTGDAASTTAYFANLDKNCPTGGAPSGTSPAGTKPVAYPIATNNHTITAYTGAASHARVGAGALAAGMAVMLVL